MNLCAFYVTLAANRGFTEIVLRELQNRARTCGVRVRSDGTSSRWLHKDLACDLRKVPFLTVCALMYSKQTNAATWPSLDYLHWVIFVSTEVDAIFIPVLIPVLKVYISVVASQSYWKFWITDIINSFLSRRPWPSFLFFGYIPRHDEGWLKLFPFWWGNEARLEYSPQCALYNYFASRSRQVSWGFRFKPIVVWSARKFSHLEVTFVWLVWLLAKKSYRSEWSCLEAFSYITHYFLYFEVNNNYGRQLEQILTSNTNLGNIEAA